MSERTDAADSKGFFKNAATLVTGNLAARVLALALYAVLTRLFAPEVFGTFAVIESIMVVLTSVCHLRLPMAILLPKEQQEVDGLALAGFVSILIFCAACWVVVFLFGPSLAAALNIPGQVWLLHWVPPIVLFTGSIQVLNQLNLRDKKFRGLAMARVATSAGGRGLAVLLGLVGQTGVASLLISRISGSLSAIGVLVGNIRLSRLRAIFAPTTWPVARAMAVRYSSFAKYSMTDLVHTAAMQLPTILLMIGFSPAAAGFFSLCRRVLAEPLSLLGQSLYRAFGERYAELQRQEKSPREFTVRFLGVLVDISIIPLLLLALAGPEIFSLVFGSKWEISGTYATLLGVFFMANFLSMPLMVLFDLKEKQRERLLFDSLLLVGNVIGLGAGFLMKDPYWAVGLFALFGAAALLYRLGYLFALADLRLAEHVRPLLARLLPSLPLCLPLVAFRVYEQSVWIPAAWAVFALLCHVGLSIRRDSLLREKLQQFLKR